MVGNTPERVMGNLCLAQCELPGSEKAVTGVQRAVFTLGTQRKQKALEDKGEKTNLEATRV